ncbi:MAG: hypothetical protein J1F22_02980 [Lachnospiraceae bacterium]|nr:hypothetical protein [Lachnospiraceae bacterium]
MKTVNAADITATQDMFYVNKPKVMPQEAAAVNEKNAKTEKSEEKDQGVTLELSENLKKMYQEQLEAAKEAAKAAGEGMQDMAKILEIARRISRGDNVPASDEKKLMEFDSDLYQTAKAAAMLHANEKHKKHDALFEDEKTDQDQKLRDLKREAASQSGGNSGGEAAAAEEVSVSEE